MFVGGCVRKYLTKEDIDDIDIATIFSPVELQEKFKETEFKIINTGIEHGSVTAVSPSSKFEITTLRIDVKTDGRHAEVSFTDNWKQDSERRDFTINAIYMNKKGKIYDPQNGREDLKKNKIKFIGDAPTRIQEDCLRIIRFLRFTIHYQNTESDPITIEAIKLNLNSIKNIAKERTLNELYKIFKLNNINTLLNNKDIKHIFTLAFPEFKHLERMEKYFYLLKAKILLQSPEIIFSILLVDTKDNHEYFCHKYKVSNKLKKNLIFMAENYKKYKNEKNYIKKDLNKNVYKLGKENMKKILGFIYCSEKKFSTLLLIKTIEEINKLEIPTFPFNGQYLIKQGLADGIKIGFALKVLEKKWVQKDFNLNKTEAITIIDKVKRLNILNI